MQEVDLRIDAAWVVPVEPEGAFAAHSVIVDAGALVAVLPSADAAARYSARSHAALPGHLLLPGLVNAHTHAAMSLFRGIADDVALASWLEDEIWPRERRFVDPDFVYDGTCLAAAEMLRGGITCCNDMYFFPEDSARAFVDAGMRAMVGLVVLDFPTNYAADLDGYLERGLRARDAWKHTKGLAFAFAPHAPWTVGDRAWERIVTYARQLDLPITTHVAETAGEVAQSRERHGATPLARLHALGVTGPSFIAVHGVHLGAPDIALLATHGGHVIHCPISNMKLGSGIAPIEDLRRSGVNLGLGTDGAASNNRLDLFGEMRAASLLAKVATGDAGAFPASAVLNAATLGGARALGLDATLGSLAPGKAADIVALRIDDLAATPCYDPVSHLIHVLGRDAVTDVWVGGRHVVDGGRLTTLDEAALRSRAQVWQERLQ